MTDQNDLAEQFRAAAERGDRAAAEAALTATRAQVDQLRAEDRARTLARHRQISDRIRVERERQGLNDDEVVSWWADA
jgi:hypothetical protein